MELPETLAWPRARRASQHVQSGRVNLGHSELLAVAFADLGRANPLVRPIATGALND